MLRIIKADKLKKQILSTCTQLTAQWVALYETAHSGSDEEEIAIQRGADPQSAERGRRRRGRRDFTRRRSRMQGGRRGRSMEERAAFRDRFVSTLAGGFF